MFQLAPGFMNTSVLYLAEAFKYPVLKFPEGKMNSIGQEDFVLLGASFNPFIAQYVHLDELAKLVPNLRVVVYRRSNKVKHAVASIRSKELNKKCHTPIVNSNCSLTGRSTVNVVDFDEWLISFLGSDQFQLSVALSLVDKLQEYRGQLFHISYEEVMGDETTVDTLLAKAGVDIKYLTWKPTAFGGRCRSDCYKNTPDDLREVVANYEELESWIKSEYSCLLTQFYETKPNIVQPDVHVVCGDKFNERIKEHIADPRNHIGARLWNRGSRT